MSTLEIRELPLVEKFRLMEALWEDMRRRFDSMTVSAEHRRILVERCERARAAPDTLLNWDEVKHTIGQR